MSYRSLLTLVILPLSNIFLLAFCGTLQTEKMSPDSIVPQQFSMPCCQFEKWHIVMVYREGTYAQYVLNANTSIHTIYTINEIRLRRTNTENIHKSNAIQLLPSSKICGVLGKEKTRRMGKKWGTNGWEMLRLLSSLTTWSLVMVQEEC